MSEQSIRVLIVDDSAFMRRALTRIIESGRGFTVVGVAGNGREGVELAQQLQPDVITLDVEMPEMDGVQALEAIMRRQPRAVVMCSSLTRHNADITLRCLELGAIDFITKPSGSVSESMESIRYVIWQKLRQAATARLVPVQRKSFVVSPPTATPVPHSLAQQVVAIGASTGGPRAVLEVLQALPATFPAGILVVQHMPPQFTTAMAQRFDGCCAVSVHEASHGEPIQDGVAYIAPGGKHMRLDAKRQIVLSDDPPQHGVRPAVDPTFTDAARAFGPACLGVILTGMGRDGTLGLGAVKQAGGGTIAQNEATCVVYGMPRAAVEARVIDQVLPLSEIGDAVNAWGAARPRRKG